MSNDPNKLGVPAEEPGPATTDDPATTELLEALDVLYPLADDTRRMERAGRTCLVLKRWIAAQQAALLVLIDQVAALRPLSVPVGVPPKLLAIAGIVNSYFNDSRLTGSEAQDALMAVADVLGKPMEPVEVPPSNEAPACRYCAAGYPRLRAGRHFVEGSTADCELDDAAVGVPPSERIKADHPWEEHEVNDRLRAASLPLARPAEPTGWQPIDPKQHPIWLLCNRIDASLRAIRQTTDLDRAIEFAAAAVWLTAEIRGYIAKLPPGSASAPTTDEAWQPAIDLVIRHRDEHSLCLKADGLSVTERAILLSAIGACEQIRAGLERLATPSPRAVALGSSSTATTLRASEPSPASGGTGSPRQQTKGSEQ